MAASGGAVLASLSESVLSVLRNQKPTVRNRNKRHATSKADRAKNAAEEELVALRRHVTRVLFNTDLVVSGNMVDLVSLSSCTSPPSLTVQHRALCSSRHALALALVQLPTPRGVRAYNTVIGRRIANSQSRFKGGTLDKVLVERAKFEFDRTQKRAETLATLKEPLERILTPNDIAELKRVADESPQDARAQERYLLAVSCRGLPTDLHIVRHRVESRSYALSPVIIGLYQDDLGLRPPPPSTFKSTDWSKIFDSVGHFFLITVGIYLLMVLVTNKQGGGGFGSLLGENDHFDVSTPTVTFEDVAGNNHALQEMEELVSYLTEPDQYTAMGCEIPKGYLLCGPPGVGKTLLAKALAGEAAVPFYYASGSGFEEVFVGVGAGRVRKLFEEAAANAPAIIFIDEIDSIGQKRRKYDSGYSNRGTLNQMLSAMDGFEANNGVIVIAATNEPDTLDEALMREGRFDTKIAIREPTLKGRLEILKVHARNKILDERVDLENLATACVGMTGAQLATLVNTAALRAVLEDREEVTQDDLEYARASILIGHVNEDLVVSEKELLNTAAHEAGHAILTLLREHITQRHLYIATVMPRGNSLGHVMPVPVADENTQETAAFLAQIDICLAGRLGEELHSGFKQHDVTTGCSSDMQQATRIAQKLIKDLGYSPRIGLVSLDGKKNDLTDAIVHEEIKKLFEERYNVVKSDLIKHKAQWSSLRDLLVQYKTLTGGEVRGVLEGRLPDRKPGEKLPSS